MDSNQDQPQSLLKDLRQHHVVSVYNPLKAPFTWNIARSVVHLQDQHRDPYIDQMKLRNESHPGMSHVTQAITIEAGQTKNLPGDVAQVYVKHLVDALIAQAGKRTMNSDPVLRRHYEGEVIKNTDSLVQRMSTLSVQEQLDQQIADLNKTETTTEAASDTTTEPVAFPGLQSGTADAGTKSPGAKAAAVK